MIDALLVLMVLLLALVGIWAVAVAVIENRKDKAFQEKEWASREFRPMAEMHRY